MKEKEKTKEEGETFVGEIYMKSKYELFGVKQQQEQDDELQAVREEDIEKAKKFLSFAIHNFKRRFFDVFRIETENFKKTEFSSELLKINSDFSVLEKHFRRMSLNGN